MNAALFIILVPGSAGHYSSRKSFVIESGRVSHRRILHSKTLFSLLKQNSVFLCFKRETVNWIYQVALKASVLSKNRDSPQESWHVHHLQVLIIKADVFNITVWMIKENLKKKKKRKKINYNSLCFYSTLHVHTKTTLHLNSFTAHKSQPSTQAVLEDWLSITSQTLLYLKLKPVQQEQYKICSCCTKSFKCCCPSISFA